MPKEITYPEAMKKAKTLFERVIKSIGKEATTQIVEKYLGENMKLSQTTEKQIEQVLMIIDDFEELLDN